MRASALEVFAARGFRAGSLNDIGKAAGLTRAGLLHHYPSKL
ncbi:TetR/AcrR family transcriptional regulator [Streptomyces sp. NBC_01231]|nr:TetR/AcrR family transcriptional regulator [Streptomyces sp. NBC_01231]